MEIVENLAHFKEAGQLDWACYVRPNNKTTPAGPGIDLSHSCLALISSAGVYLRDTQAPFNAPDPLGEYTTHLFPSATPFEALAYAHEHYDYMAVLADPEVLLSLRHLEALMR